MKWYGKLILGIFAMMILSLVINYFRLMRTDDRLPNLDKSYDSYVFLASRAYGEAFTLTGDVLVTVVFVSEPGYSWNQLDIQETKQRIESENEELEKAAAKYDVQLDLQVRYLERRVEEKLDREEYTDWARAAVETPGRNWGSTSSAVEREFDVKEAPYMLCTPREGRSFARAAEQDGYFEFGVLYENGKGYAHELCHLFGAEDLYYPQEVKDLAEDCFGQSLMLESKDVMIDSLTAYLIGWTDQVSEEALRFIDETAWITPELRDQQRREENFTGSGTREFDGGTYTGDLANGVPHGQGRLEYDSGAVYEGQFVYGEPEGTGTYCYPDGDVYVGQMRDGLFYGTGTYTWAEGRTYEGQFQKGELHGFGRYTWEDGAYYEGQFRNSEFHGEGKQVSPNGRTITGIWENGEYVQ